LVGIGVLRLRFAAIVAAGESAYAQPTVTHQVEFLWFEDCPNHDAARAMLHEVIDDVAPGTTVRDIDATDPEVARAHRFPGSPTIRVDGKDVDPTFIDPGDYTPRCRLFRTDSGIVRVPELQWIEDALR
jgi:hypothetical protein